MVETGIKGHQELTVTAANVATNVGSGTLINVSHCAATPVGMKVWADTEVIAVDRRKVTFSVKACDERGLIGEGTHERFIIDIERFMAKASGA